MFVIFFFDKISILPTGKSVLEKAGVCLLIIEFLVVPPALFVFLLSCLQETNKKSKMNNFINIIIIKGFKKLP